MPGMVMKAVEDLYVECSLWKDPEKPEGPWMRPDRCCGPAVSAVEMEDGSKMYRCRDHEGLRRRTRNGGREYGPVWVHVEVRDREEQAS